MSTEYKEHITSQPHATAAMTVGGNRNALSREVGVDGQRDWSFGLFDCTDECKLCCWAAWCPCVVYTKNKQRLRHLQSHGTPLPGGGERFNADCVFFGYLTLTGYYWVLSTGSRRRVRSRYNIRGGRVNDCCVSTFCRCCSLAQERREIELEENSFEGVSQSE